MLLRHLPAVEHWRWCFGVNVFGLSVMKTHLPKDAYKAVKRTIELGTAVIDMRYENPLYMAEDAAAADNVGAIKKAARVSGMRPVVDGSPPQPMDIVVMYGVGTLHCGVVVKVNGRLHVLHAAHEAGVVCEPWQHATQGLSVELWRQIK